MKRLNTQNRQLKRSYQKKFLTFLLILLAINWIGQYEYQRFDLTSNKRFSLSQASIQLLKTLHDNVHFIVYLKGDFPQGFKQLQKQTKEMLEEFAARSSHIRFRFVDPTASSTIQERNRRYRRLIDEGLRPTNLQVKTKNGLEQQIIFPGAIVRYKNKEIAVSLLESQINIPPEQVINHSIENLEYQLMHAVHSLTQKSKPSIAFLRGQGELHGKDIADIIQSLRADYSLSFVSPHGNRDSLLDRRTEDNSGHTSRIMPRYKVVIIAGPDSSFSEKDKLVLDQYLMYGGKILWLIDPVVASMDSIRQSESTVSIDRKLGLQEQLFTYGIRLNKNLILDINAAPIPVHTGQMGNQPQINFLPWYYDPIISPRSKNPIVKNLNSIRLSFVSSVDTLAVKGIKKTILLKTSPYSGVEKVPGIISLAILRKKPDPYFFSGPARNVAVLLEGIFPSDFTNRLFPGMKSKVFPFRKQSLSTAMVVVSDADIIRNQLKIPGGYPLPLGYDQFTRQTYGNKAFILNAINYLSEGPGLISLRKRELKLRLLDKEKINKQRLPWQLFNVLVPLGLMLIFCLVLVIIRKRRFQK